MSLTFKVGVGLSVNCLWKRSPRHTQKCVSQVILNQVTLTTIINYHTDKSISGLRNIPVFPCYLAVHVFLINHILWDVVSPQAFGSLLMFSEPSYTPAEFSKLVTPGLSLTAEFLFRLILCVAKIPAPLLFLTSWVSSSGTFEKLLGGSFIDRRMVQSKHFILIYLLCFSTPLSLALVRKSSVYLVTKWDDTCSEQY